MIIEGKVSNERNKNPLSNIKIQIEGTSFTTLTNEIGEFILRASHLTHIVLYIEAYGFETKRIPIAQEHGSIELGTIFLLPKLEAEENDNLIALTETELADDEGVGMANALLRATRDVFLTRAAFDFGQAFFRVRGYDSQRGEVRINGLRMNKFYDGRPQWNQWGGLNDVTRNQEYTHGLDFNTTTFGGILGTTTIDTRPSGLRKGTRVSSSLSNRTYAGRIMASYNSGLFKNRLAFTLSASRRWAKQGYIEGTLYDAYSVYGSLEYQFNEANTLQFTGIYAHNRRGRSAAITEEVYTLKGKKYNPYWGEQNGEIRNSRERTIAEPLIFFNYYLKLPQFTWHNGISYSFGKQTRGRLGYFNAPNPDPTYYRYLPSFYVNSPLGANFESAEVSREAFLSESQINWQNVYQANENRSSYVLSDDTINDRVVTASSVAELNISDGLVANFGANIKQTKTDAYAKINDLFGQVILKDIDPFTNTRNDVNDPIDKRVGDIFNYHYQVNASAFDIFAQAKFDYGNLRVFGSIGFESTRYQRNGIYKNNHLS